MEERFLEQSEAMTDMVRDSGVNVCRKQAVPTEDLKPEEYVRLDCLDCGEELELFRLQKGRERCVHCQTVKENAKRR